MLLFKESFSLGMEEVFMKSQHEITNDYKPSIEELNQWYSQEMKIEANQALYDRSAKASVEENDFFRAFAKTDSGQSILTKDNRFENPYYIQYRDYIERETEREKKRIEAIEKEIAYHQFFLRHERRMSGESSAGRHYGTTETTRYRVDQIKKQRERLDQCLSSSPEAWQFYYQRQIIRDIKTQHQQRLVQVPYVMQAKQKVVDALELGLPVYIVGHLGSGKTQLATEAALDFTIQNRMQIRLETMMNQWFKLNKGASEAEAIDAFYGFYLEEKTYYDEIFKNGSKEEIEALQPLFISGSHNLTYEDMFVEKSLSLAHSFSQKSYADYLNMIIEDFYDWMGEHRERLEKMSEEEQLQLKIQIWKSFSDLLVANNSSFGTVIQKIEREILIAVREGRPVIVDELNTIAMQNLIGLNDLLQRHAGSTAYITGVGPVFIKPGFGFIGTGNLSSQMVNYEGTNALNPAFKSRFVTLEYNYVPQETIGYLREQKNPEKNQLFRVMMAQLADESGNIQLPHAERTLEELFNFSKLARVTQNVFMGKWKIDDSSQGEGIEAPELKESVLSIRNILHVLDNWNQGEEKDLSQALWEGFIGSITEPDDQNYILCQAVRFGFFPASEGWSVSAKEVGSPTSSYDEIRSRPYRYERPEMEVLSLLDVVALVFGDDMCRRELPDCLKKELETSNLEATRISPQKYQYLDRKMLHLEHSKHLLEYLEAKEEEED